jgi:hypothetical protein
MQNLGGGNMSHDPLFAMLHNAIIRLLFTRDAMMCNGVKGIICTIHEDGDTSHDLWVIHPVCVKGPDIERLPIRVMYVQEGVSHTKHHRTSAIVLNRVLCIGIAKESAPVPGPPPTLESPLRGPTIPERLKGGRLDSRGH